MIDIPPSAESLMLAELVLESDGADPQMRAAAECVLRESRRAAISIVRASLNAVRVGVDMPREMNIFREEIGELQPAAAIA